MNICNGSCCFETFFFINLFIVFLKKTFSDLYFETSFVKFGNLNF